VFRRFVLTNASWPADEHRVRSFTLSSSTFPHLRFATATAVVLALAGSGLFLFVRSSDIRDAELNESARAEFIEEGILRDALRPSDLRAPATGARLAQLDRLFASRILNGGVLRVKIYRGPDGVVVYSNVHSLLGTKAEDMTQLRTVLSGQSIHDTSYLNHEGGTGSNVKALEVYVPLRVRGQEQQNAHAVLELYQSYAPVAATVRTALVPFAGLLLLALLGMWAVLFPLVRGMAGSLTRSRAEHRATELALEETSQELRQSQKMSALGRLAGGVGHDFNNLLLAINGYAGTLSDSLEDERLKGFADAIGSAGRRAAYLTQQLLAFSRRLEPRKVTMNLNDAANEIEPMLRRVIDACVRIDFDLDRDLSNVEADPNQVGQMLLNLAVNARDAMHGPGTLTISTHNDGGEVVLQVTDTGDGMDEATQMHVFEPFFTTRDGGAGTGLGLSTVYGVVAQCGGTITVRSRPRFGTTFTVRLPASERAIAGAVEPLPEAPDGAKRILVVADEHVVGEFVAQILRDQDEGYEVSVARSAREARALEGPWNLLITDVVMPETSGIKLARRIDAGRVVFMSGYGQEAIERSGSILLHKPFSGDELARAVRTTLGRGRVPLPAAA
jgi:signal transduction histidine kinase/CheY-like chemotaxis protein